MKLVKRILSIALVAGVFSSCKKDLLDINVDPNNPTTVSASADLVLPAALNTTAAIYNNPTGQSRFVWAGLWMGHIGYSGNYAIATENISYAITTNFENGASSQNSTAFSLLYDNNTDYDFVEQKGVQSGNTFYRAIGMLMKAYNYQTLVDLYNNVPYTQALQGTKVSNPAYDNGKAIYDDLAKRMDTAISLFKVSGSTAIGGDIMFGGDATKWLQFANTVKLRLLLRQTQVADRQSYIQTEAAKFSGATFLTTDAIVNPGYLNSSGKTNPFWGANVNTAGTYTQDLYRAGAYAVNFYQSNNDPRLAKFYAPTGSGTFAGNAFGDQGAVNSKTSTIGPGVLKSFSQGAVIMLAAESYFLQAEAALRGLISGDAKTLYQNGVTASFTYLGLTAAQAQTYYSQAGNKQVNWDATTSTQEKVALIIRQKWAAETWINELEPYNDYRRLRLPADVPLSSSPFSTGSMPNRLLYPQREYEVNGANVTAQGNITPTSKVWWMP
jgi:hypothetical protein